MAYVLVRSVPHFATRARCS